MRDHNWNEHWGRGQATSRCLRQCCLVYWRIYVTRPQWVKGTAINTISPCVSVYLNIMRFFIFGQTVCFYILSMLAMYFIWLVSLKIDMMHELNLKIWLQQRRNKLIILTVIKSFALGTIFINRDNLIQYCYLDMNKLSFSNTCISMECIYSSMSFDG